LNSVVSTRNKHLVQRDEAVIGYLLAGYPEPTEFLHLLREVEATGLDALEIGYPSENPFADGEIIQAAHRAVNRTLARDVAYWRQIRQSVALPIWLMAYKDDFITSGVYLEFARARVMDAIVIPDCSHEEHIQLAEELSEHEVDVVHFIRPSMSVEEMKRVAADAPLIYGQLYNGPTGSFSREQQDYNTMLEAVLESFTGKIYAGFGIDSRARIEELLRQGFHGTILGTALIKRLNESPAELIRYLRQLKGGEQ